jgi:type I restriction enzyme R subunit
MPTEYTEVELPLLRQLLAMGCWSHIEGSKSDPFASERETFREVVLSRWLRAALRRINLDDEGNEWLDESRVAQAEASLLRPSALKLIEANQEATSRLLTGTTVDGVEGRDGGRGQTVHYIDWEHPERNDFLAVNQFRVDEPGGQAHKYVVPDIVLFVNGIPLVVIECKSPYVTNPGVEAINQLQRYANQRRHVHDDEGNERLFHTNQFVVATYFDKAMVGTFTAQSDHFAEWKETEPVSREDVAAELGKAPDDLSSQEVLVPACCAPLTCSTSSATSRSSCLSRGARSRSLVDISSIGRCSDRSSASPPGRRGSKTESSIAAGASCGIRKAPARA